MASTALVTAWSFFTRRGCVKNVIMEPLLVRSLVRFGSAGHGAGVEQGHRDLDAHQHARGGGVAASIMPRSPGISRAAATKA
jgi:hypothetical protein